MKKIICPDCQQEFAVEGDKIVVGELVDCPNCGAEMEIQSVEPIKVELIEEQK